MAACAGGLGFSGAAARGFGLSCGPEDALGFFVGSDVITGGDAISGELIVGVNALGSASDAACDSWFIE
jgi:hypothetical protein